MRLPQWWLDHKDIILQNIYDFKTIKHYNIWHDIGKPFCRTVDADGKQHFPNHAEISKQTWLNLGGNPIIGDLIGYDMVMHTETKEQIEARNLSTHQAFTLLVTALAEIHSNAQMFGGIESTSFKIKWKKIDKIGKFLTNKLIKETHQGNSS
jgi:methyltransferase-like protein